ncbi:hypothetical protein H310_09162 [Aphanomyces invadans]|uniref:Kinesin-like protein n=1 Tax=Aphanomyces invadans TaxID=157072 RepID=A0A024TV08_9STRA|nr:hypothetical protein H310_09162 [Aphanomyces invadans]ETV97814.1 hypothetical protein H310_09162 [Aphanomyces invadans]|eukprot:XP_008873375.1 hypothetical protein H310_09162 [Aphanomyces invadans]
MHRLINTLPLLLQEMDASSKASPATAPPTAAPGNATPAKAQSIPIPVQVKVNKLIRNTSNSSLFADLAKEHESKLSEVEAQLASEKMTVERLDLDVLTLKESLLQAQQLQHDTESQVKAQTALVEALQRDATDMKAKLNALVVTCQSKDDEVDTHVATISSLHHQLAALQQDIASFSNVGEGKDARIVELSATLQEKDALLAAQNHTIASLTLQVASAHAKTASLVQSTASMAGDLQALKAHVTMEAAQTEALIQSSIHEMQAVVQSREHVLYSQLDREILERKRMTEKYHEVSGKIRVFCRVRPLQDAATNESAFMYPKSQTLLVASKRQEYVFDQVYGPDSTQEDVYEHIDPLIGSVMDGYNACVMAYGQTGAGKTYSMVGEDSSPGIIPRALHQLFAMSDARSALMDDTISISMQEIYNDQPRDLLSKDVLTPKESAMETRVVGSWNDVQAVLAEGYANRSVAATKMNFESSRSHAIVFVYVSSANKQTLERKSSTLCLVDLAGSERISRTQVTGDRLKEAQHINKSLSTLGDVVHALQHKAKHVPYRNSKLTFTLRDMLSGGAKALLMLQVSPDIADEGESVCSLQFGARVSQVELGAVKQRSVESGELLALKDELAKVRADHDAVVAKMQRELDAVRDEVAAAGNQSQGYGATATSSVSDDNDSLDDEWKKLNDESPETNAGPSPLLPSSGSSGDLKKRVLTKRATTAMPSSTGRLSLGRSGPPPPVPPKPVRQTSLDRRLSLPVKGQPKSEPSRPAAAATSSPTLKRVSSTVRSSSPTSRVARHSLGVAEGSALREKSTAVRTKGTIPRPSPAASVTSPPTRKWV